MDRQIANAGARLADVNAFLMNALLLTIDRASHRGDSHGVLKTCGFALTANCAVLDNSTAPDQNPRR
jgi:hypothetical protein